MKLTNVAILSLLSSLTFAVADHSSSSSGTTQQVGQSVAGTAASRHHRKKQHKRSKAAAVVSTPVVPLPASCSSVTVRVAGRVTGEVFGVINSPSNLEAPQCPDFSCWHARMTDSRTCFTLTGHPQISSAICTQDSTANGTYVCLATPLGGKKQVNVNCSLPIPTGQFNVVFVTSACSISHVQPCTATNSIASCSVYDPLVLDMNHNGIVEAKAGEGIDLNLGGKPIGAAVNGDKMLAMSSLTGTGKIDGRSVFGDQTISPFTGKPYHAKNGFESLHSVALEAQKMGNVRIIHGNSVNVIKLAAELLKLGVTLGFVSDNDDTVVEPLYGVKTINLKYKQVNDNQIVSRKQVGTFEDMNGNIHPIDDVWFSV